VKPFKRFDRRRQWPAMTSRRVLLSHHLLGDGFFIFAAEENRRSILSADIIALAVQSRWVVELKEKF
jgi:hypothetical protein